MQKSVRVVDAALALLIAPLKDSLLTALVKLG